MTAVEELQRSKSTGQVLLYTRAKEDASTIRDVLAPLATEVVVCPDIQDLCRRMMQEDVDAVLLTETSLADGTLPILVEVLQAQPHWSDLPVLFMAGGGLESPSALQVMRELPNVLILDRPVRIAALTSALQMALRVRGRQRQTRDLLEERARTEEALEKANERLGAQTDELATVNEQLLTEREELQRHATQLDEQSRELHQLKNRAERTARTMQNLARLVEENPDPAMRVSPDGRIQYGNPASLQLYHQWNGLDPRKVPPTVGQIVSEAHAKGRIIRREMTFGEHTYLIAAAPAPLPAQYINLYVRDISGRKQAEQMLADDLAATKRLQQIGSRFVKQGELTEVLGELLDAAMAITHADMGNFQLLDAPSGSLQIFAARGFEQPFLDFWKSVTEGHGACGTALERGERVVVEDVLQSPIFVGTPALQVQLDAGVRAVQATPLFSHSGMLLGVLSTHWRTSHRPDPHELHLLDLLVLEAVDIIERAHAEETLRQSEERLHALVTASSQVVYRMSPDWSEMRQLQSRSFLANTDEPSHTWLQEYIPEEDQPQVQATIQEAIRTKSVFELEHRVRRADGSLGWTFSRAVPLLDINGEILEWFGAASDITSRKQAEETLRQSEQRLALALSGTQIGMYDRDLATGEVRGTEQVARLLGLRPTTTTTTTTTTLSQEYDYHVWAERVHPEDRARLEEDMRRYMTADAPYELEYRVLWPDGSVHWLVDRGVLQRDPDGRPVRLLGIAMDITARKRAEEALQESHARLKRVLEVETVGVMFWDLKSGHLMDANDTFLKMMGYGRREIEAGELTWQRLTAPEYMEVSAEAVQQCLATGRFGPFEKEYIRKDGTRRWFVFAGSSLDSATAVEFCVDISDRKQAEQALRQTLAQAEERRRILEAMMEHIPLGITIADAPDTNIRMVSRYGRELVEKTTEELTGIPAGEHPQRWQIYHTDGVTPAMPEELPLTRATQRGELVKEEEWIVARRDGTKIPILCTAAPICDKDGNITGGVIGWQDITQQKQAAAELVRLNEELEQRVQQRTAELRRRTRQLQKLALEMSEVEDRERERLVHILHDDLQQELAAAKFHLSILRSRIRYEPSAQEVAVTIDEMLRDAISKSRSLSHELSPAVLRQGDVTEILRWLASEMQTKHGLVVHVQGQAPPPPDTVKAFLYRTAQELLFNAVKHAQVPEVRVRVRQCGAYICLSVSDRGRGFDPEGLREAAGFGLLSIRERVELIGGRMKIRSAPGKGSTFFVVVPAGVTAGQLSGRAEPAELRADEDHVRLRVLLADDHEVVRQGLVALLNEDEAFDVVGEATDGREAVELADRLHPDVVVMDVSMPVMNGEEATRRIKEHLPRTRIVSLSMREEPEVRERMCQAGAESYVLKTAPGSEVLAAIRGEDPNS